MVARYLREGSHALVERQRATLPPGAAFLADAMGGSDPGLDVLEPGRHNTSSDDAHEPGQDMAQEEAANQHEQREQQVSRGGILELGLSVVQEDDQANVTEQQQEADGATRQAQGGAL